MLVINTNENRAMTTTYETLLDRIAEQHLGLDTLETRNSDSLDFHDLAVWSIHDALEAAFKAGVEVGAEVIGRSLP